jgi:hypothetical protein
MSRRLRLSEEVALNAFGEAERLRRDFGKLCAAYVVGYYQDSDPSDCVDFHLSVVDIRPSCDVPKLYRSRFNKPTQSGTGFVNEQTLEYALGLAQREADAIGDPIMMLVMGNTPNGVPVKVVLATDVDVDIPAVCKGLNQLMPHPEDPKLYYFVNHALQFSM